MWYLAIWLMLPRIIRDIIFWMFSGIFIVAFALDSIDIYSGLFFAAILALWLYSNIRKKKTRTEEQVEVRNKRLKKSFILGSIASSVVYFATVYNPYHSGNLLGLACMIILVYIFTLRNIVPVKK